MGCLATNVMENRVDSTAQSVVVNMLVLYYGEMYREPTDRFLPVSSCFVCSILLLELGRGDRKNDPHCGSCLHLATIFCLYLYPAQLNTRSSGKCGVVEHKMGKKSAMKKWINVCLFIVSDHGISGKSMYYLCLPAVPC